MFSAPVPRGGAGVREEPLGERPALYTLSLTGGPPVRLTFGLLGATDPTVLADGRILFVSGVPSGERGTASGTSLFTINNDGTEISPFAGQHDPPARVGRPRDSGDGRILFLAAGVGESGTAGRIEQVPVGAPLPESVRDISGTGGPMPVGGAQQGDGALLGGAGWFGERAGGGILCDFSARSGGGEPRETGLGRSRLERGGGSVCDPADRG